MKDAALETLFYAFEQNPQIWPQAGMRVLFLNARAHGALSQFSDLTLQQGFYLDAAGLTAHGFASVADGDVADDGFDCVLILLPKNYVEALYLIARGIAALKDGGVLACAAENKAGGSRIKGMLRDLGCTDFMDVSKNKARCAWFHKEDFNQNAVLKAIAGGGVQEVLDGSFVSQPGVFGWDKIDRGSEVLAEALPDDLSGLGADFGCGYGYLARQVLTRCAGVRSLLCVDADHRAVEMARRNVGGERAVCVWGDLTRAIDTKSLDFIVMNPPFHMGKVADHDIGVAFIETAAAALRPNGVLWMVANVGLPYEGILQARFGDVAEITKAHGFKVFRAVK